MGLISSGFDVPDWNRLCPRPELQFVFGKSIYINFPFFLKARTSVDNIRSEVSTFKLF